jgi:hypothetical protein
MGYTTTFTGAFRVEPPLSADQTRYLKAFADSLHLKRSANALEDEPDPLREAVGLPLGQDACYFVGDVAKGHDAYDHPSVIDHTAQPAGQPSQRCQWIPSPARQFLVGSEGASVVERAQWIGWDGEEKFYGYVEWLEYMIKHFLEPWGYKLTGSVEWEGEDGEDRGIISISGNQVEALSDQDAAEEGLCGAALDEALARLKRPNVEVQRETIDMLLCVASGHPLFVDALKELVLGDPHEWVRLDAAEALGSLGQRAVSSAPQLIKALDDAFEYVAAAAACSLGQLGSTDADVKRALDRAKESDRYAVRVRAIEAIEALEKLETLA